MPDECLLVLLLLVWAALAFIGAVGLQICFFR